MISCSCGMFDYYCEFSLHCKSSTTLRSHPQIGGMSITARLQRLLPLLLNYARPGLLLQLGSLLLVLIFLRIWARPLRSRPPSINCGTGHAPKQVPFGLNLRFLMIQPLSFRSGLLSAPPPISMTVILSAALLKAWTFIFSVGKEKHKP